MRFFIIMCVFQLSINLWAKTFNISDLPNGANVTILDPATTKIPIGERVQFAPTSMPQSLSLILKNNKLTSAKVTIYDSSASKVRYVNIKPNSTFVYSFLELKPIVIRVTSEDKSSKGLHIIAKSNKPLTIGH